jgi:folate-dependent phosphoribosylglycinamide formyltransferase PurN
MSTQRPRLAMLVGQGLSSRIMYNALADDFDVAMVIQEDRPSRRQLVRRRISRLGPAKVAGQLLFMCYDRLYLERRQRARIAELVARYQLDTAPIPEGAVTPVASVNSDRTIELLRQCAPDAVVVNGTRIISSSVLSCIPAPFVNTHAGITPRYRGVHGGYWALASRDAKHCVTVHLVDAGIDTGAVLYQEAIEAEAEDGFHTYPVHQTAKAIPLMKSALLDVAAGCLRPGPGIGPSRLWSHPTLFEYVRNRVLTGVR